MKRVVTVSWLLLVFCHSVFGQLGRISGELRYEQRYQDFLYGDNLTKILIQSPSLNLRMSGSIVSSRLLTYWLYSSLNATYVNTGNAYYDYSGAQYSWNRYNLILNMLPYSPVKLTLGARENATDYKSSADDGSDQSGIRQQEQRAEISVHQVPWLPTLSLSYVRNRSYAQLANVYDLVSQTVTFTASHASDTTGSYYLTATMSDFRDQLSNAYDRFVTFEFSASKAFSARHGVNISTEYNQYTGYSMLGSAIAYSGTLSNRLRVNTGLSGTTTTSSFAQYRSFGFAQTASYFINDNFQGNVGFNGSLGSTHVKFADGGRRNVYGNWGTSGGIQHRRSFSGLAISNALFVGYSAPAYTSNIHTFSAMFSNNISRSIGTFSMYGDYNFSYVRVLISTPYSTIGNSAAFVVNGTLPRQIQSQTDVRYRDDRYNGEATAYRNQRSLMFTQRFNGSFVYRIPFTLGLSGSANWYLSNITGHSYGWTANFASPSFFLRGLAFDYAYSRSYDPYYEREIAEHNASLSYQWRSLSFTSRFRYATFPTRVREVWFSVSRPF